MKEFEQVKLDGINFAVCEGIMIKSLKKGETSKIEILSSYLKEHKNNILFLNNIEFDYKSRICYEITLNNFIENNEKQTKKGKKYTMFKLAKGNKMTNLIRNY